MNMEIKNKKMVKIIIYISITFIIGLVFGRLFIEQIKLNEAQKKINNIDAKYNELTSEYEALKAKYKNEIK